MNVLDANVLIALYRADHTHHESALRWWDRAIANGEPFTVPDVVWLGFCRLVTNRHVVPVPATFDEAWQFIDAVAGHALHLRYASDTRIMSEFRRLGAECGAKGDLVPDAYIAACASTLGATVVTFDRDFRKFDGVKVLELS